VIVSTDHHDGHIGARADGFDKLEAIHPRQIEIGHQGSYVIRGQAQESLFSGANSADHDTRKLHESYFEHIAAGLGVLDDENGTGHEKLYLAADKRG
jgi:hypothetical protein